MTVIENINIAYVSQDLSLLSSADLDIVMKTIKDALFAVLSLELGIIKFEFQQQF